MKKPVKPDFARLIKRDEYRVVPWKNGKGKSAEIAIWPEGSAAAESFLWRLSSARIDAPGPFSIFTDYDRYLALVEGQELKLIFGTGGGEREGGASGKKASPVGRDKLLKPGEVFRFPGEEEISCELPAGAVTDLNLIVKRGRVRVEFSFLNLTAKPRSFQLGKGVVFLFGVSGQIVASVFPGEMRFTLRECETLRVNELGMALGNGSGAALPERLILLEPADPECVLIVVELI